MGPAGAANIIFKNDPDVKAKTEEYIDNFATPYQAAMRGMVDLVIEPQNTRPTVINALQMLQSKPRPALRNVTEIFLYSRCTSFENKIASFVNAK